MSAVDARVTTVVVSRDRREQLLRSLPRHHPPVILVDNGSTDGTVAAVRERLPDVHVVALDTNHGSPGRTVGVELAQTPYVAFADDDSWWSAGALDTCADVFDKHPRVGVVAGRVLVGPEQRLDPLCRMLTRSPLPQRLGVPGRPVLGFMACGAVVRREAYLQAGGFDDVVFFAGEEDRLAWDMAARGWELTYLPEAVAHHHPETGKPAHPRRRLVTRNAILTTLMRRPWPVLVRQAVQASRSRAELAGLLDAVPRAPAALRMRRRLPEDVEARLRALHRR